MYGIIFMNIFIYQNILISKTLFKLLPSCKRAEETHLRDLKHES